MFNHRVMLALNDLLSNAESAINNTNFIVASQGQPGRGSNKAVICTSTNPTMMNILLVLKNCFEQLNDQMTGSETTNKIELIEQLQEALKLLQTMLEVEKQLEA